MRRNFVGQQSCTGLVCGVAGGFVQGPLVVNIPTSGVDIHFVCAFNAGLFTKISHSTSLALLMIGMG